MILNDTATLMIVVDDSAAATLLKRFWLDQAGGTGSSTLSDGETPPRACSADWRLDGLNADISVIITDIKSFPVFVSDIVSDAWHTERIPTPRPLSVIVP